MKQLDEEIFSSKMGEEDYELLDLDCVFNRKLYDYDQKHETAYSHRSSLRAQADGENHQA